MVSTLLLTSFAVICSLFSLEVTTNRFADCTCLLNSYNLVYRACRASILPPHTCASHATSLWQADWWRLYVSLGLLLGLADGSRSLYWRLCP